MFDVTHLLYCGLNQVMFLFLGFDLFFRGFLSMLEELSDSLWRIDLSIYLMMEGGWFEEVLM